eukprot:30136-Pelagococcus_subviridis.AAC.4
MNDRIARRGTRRGPRARDAIDDRADWEGGGSIRDEGREKDLGGGSTAATHRAVELRDGLLRDLLGRHLHEPEAAAAAGVHVRYDRDPGSVVLREDVREHRVVHAPRQVTDVELHGPGRGRRGGVDAAVRVVRVLLRRRGLVLLGRLRGEESRASAHRVGRRGDGGEPARAERVARDARRRARDGEVRASDHTARGARGDRRGGFNESARGGEGKSDHFSTHEVDARDRPKTWRAAASERASQWRDRRRPAATR